MVIARRRREKIVFLVSKMSISKGKLSAAGENLHIRVLGIQPQVSDPPLGFEPKSSEGGGHSLGNVLIDIGQ